MVAWKVTMPDPGIGALDICDATRRVAAGGSGEWEEVIQARLLRDVFGNPFQPISFAPSWRTPIVIALARSIYDDGAWDQLPILADALEEAGCANGAILEHCRSPGPHVRGCWVLDLVLEKE